jgi:hypothetical protein
MSDTDLLGYLASAAVLATFTMNAMVWLRLLAILSNVLFIAYGTLAHLPPVLGLHAVLLPLNVLRLLQMTNLITKKSIGLQ